MNKRKLIVILLIIVAALVIIAVFCHRIKNGSSDNRLNLEEVNGRVEDTGLFSVFVPEGWLGVSSINVVDDYYGPTVFTIYKCVEDESDARSTPFVIVNYMGVNTTLLSPRSSYESVEDLNDMTFGNYTYTVYTGISLGHPYTILEAQGDHSDFLISICMENENGVSISLNDADVQEILDSITVTDPDVATEHTHGIRPGVDV